VLLTAGSGDPLFPADGVDEVVAAFAPGVCTPFPFDGGHEVTAEVTAAAVEFLVGSRRP
jgi:hypothetical protein